MEKEQKEKLFEEKKRQILKILDAEDITYGMAKSIIQAVEAELMEKGNTFLSRSMLKNVFPHKT